MTPLQIRLKELNACSEAIDWVGSRTFEEAWKECERPDWMFWLLFHYPECLNMTKLSWSIHISSGSTPQSIASMVRAEVPFEKLKALIGSD
jgi:hypothetical protein